MENDIILTSTINPSSTTFWRARRKLSARDTAGAHGLVSARTMPNLSPRLLTLTTGHGPQSLMDSDFARLSKRYS